MKTISVSLEDELDALLEAICNEQGRGKGELVNHIVRRYLESERVKQTLQDPALAELYQQMAIEDVMMAEEGMAEYEQMLREADQA